MGLHLRSRHDAAKLRDDQAIWLLGQEIRVEPVISVLQKPRNRSGESSVAGTPAVARSRVTRRKALKTIRMPVGASQPTASRK